jgi:hypothetical protein
MRATESLVPEPSFFEAEVAIESCKDINHQVLIQFRQNWSKQEVVHYDLRTTNILILFRIRKSCHSIGRNLLLYVFIKMVIQLAIVILEEYHCYQQHIKCYLILLSQGQLHTKTKLLGIISVDIDVTDQVLIRYSTLIRYGRNVAV